jgi:hypothetical protein
MSLKHCESCGQSLPSERREKGLCERCERAQRASEVEAKVERLEAELQEQQDFEERVLELLKLGLSPAQVLDYIFIEDKGYSVTGWADTRSVTPPAVYNNLSTADPVIDEQTRLSSYDTEPYHAERQHVPPEETEGGAPGDGAGADPGSIGFQ